MRESCHLCRPSPARERYRGERRLVRARPGGRRAWSSERTMLPSKMVEFEAANRGLDNVAAAREMAGLLLRLVRGELVDRPTSDAVLGVLEQTQDDALIRRYLPARTRVAHKTGSLEKVRNDAAVIWASTDRPPV